MVYVMIYMIKYLFKQKIILYEKNFEQLQFTAINKMLLVYVHGLTDIDK